MNYWGASGYSMWEVLLLNTSVFKKDVIRDPSSSRAVFAAGIMGAPWEQSLSTMAVSTWWEAWVWVLSGGSGCVPRPLEVSPSSLSSLRAAGEVVHFLCGWVDIWQSSTFWEHETQGNKINSYREMEPCAAPCRRQQCQPNFMFLHSCYLLYRLLPTVITSLPWTPLTCHACSYHLHFAVLGSPADLLTGLDTLQLPLRIDGRGLVASVSPPRLGQSPSGWAWSSSLSPLQYAALPRGWCSLFRHSNPQ